MSIIEPPTEGVKTPPQSRWTSEGVAFLRRVMGGEVYTGMSGEALARWAVGLDDMPAERPHDRADLARCMNVYWSAPDALQLKMRPQIEAWCKRLSESRARHWRYAGPPDFEVRRYYRRYDNLNDYWATERPGGGA